MCIAEGVDHPRYLMRLAEMELIDRERRMVETPDQGRQVPDRQEPRQLRLPCSAIAEQDAGSGTGAFGLRRSP